MLDLTLPSALAADITWRASRQTYLTIRWLVDRDRIPHAFCAYAYFRWVDDYLDQPTCSSANRLNFLHRQQEVITACEQGHLPPRLTPYENLLAVLIQSDPDPESGLRTYIHHMMSVMRFDAERRGQMVTEEELERYTHWLAVAVTEALHYFIGHHCPPSRHELRYRAATAAHIVHMLRDTYEDTALGYFNFPREIAEAAHILPQDIHSPPYRDWVRNRVERAREDFQSGRAYLAQVPNLRCRLAGYAYIGRFAGLLETIERENYALRPTYSECKHPFRGLSMLTSALWQTFLPSRTRATGLTTSKAG
ncbi:MAG: phytoene/squalene synthase family protein [Thermanaerothrix sp.]|uniref:phytoene/squalene synthase family protein n=1 Tax=Thermanaerothrix sp. TaxID=2972675 RepID=UPI003C7D47D0